MKRLLLVLVLFIFGLFLTKYALAQRTAEELRLEEEERRKALEETELRILRGEERILYDYGGWLTTNFTDFNNTDRDSDTTDAIDYQFYTDLRFWIKATLNPSPDYPDQRPHSMYLRIKDSLIRRTPHFEDHDGPHLDMAYVRLDYFPYVYRIGRQYFRVGRGIAYGAVHDGVEFTATLPKWKLKASFSHTLPHEDNIDTSVPGYEDNTERRFYSVEWSYLGMLNHTPYAYFLVQDDHTVEHPVNALSDYRYDSRYFGLGSKGQFIIPNLRYWMEWIWESGKSTYSASTNRADIYAWALDTGLTYYWPVKTHPAFTFEYAFGSGDNDRTNVTNTTNGNTGGDDNNFLYFGSFPSGYVLGTRLSNIHIYKFGAFLKPLEQWKKTFEELTVGTNYYIYRKDEPKGGVYDTYATNEDRDIGSEIDIFADWRILSDLMLSMKFGIFYTGEAYSADSDDNEKYFTTSLTFIF